MLLGSRVTRSLSLCVPLQSETAGSKVSSAVAAHAVDNKVEETRETQVCRFVHVGWYHTCTSVCRHMRTHTPHTHTHTHTNEHNHHTHTCTRAQTHTTVCLYELVSWCVNEYHSFMYITVYTKYLSLLLPSRRMATKRRGRRHLMTPLRVYQMQCLPPRG